MGSELNQELFNNSLYMQKMIFINYTVCHLVCCCYYWPWHFICLHPWYYFFIIFTSFQCLVWYLNPLCLCVGHVSSSLIVCLSTEHLYFYFFFLFCYLCILCCCLPHQRYSDFLFFNYTKNGKTMIISYCSNFFFIWKGVCHCLLLLSNLIFFFFLFFKLWIFFIFILSLSTPKY